MDNVAVISAILSVTGAVATVILGGVFEWRRRRADRCLGYVAFRRKYRDDPEFAEWFSPLLEQIDGLIDRPQDAVRRLTTVHNALLDLITFLDPRKVWILGPHRKFERKPLPTYRSEPQAT